jgi:hypothetical protein
MHRVGRCTRAGPQAPHLPLVTPGSLLPLMDQATFERIVFHPAVNWSVGVSARIR